MKAWYQTVAVGAGLSVLAWVGFFSNGVPTLICPMPSLTLILALVLLSLHAYSAYRLAIFVPALLFFAWNGGLFRGNMRVPKRSWALMAALTALSLGYFVVSWKYGNHYQGREYTVAICAINAVWILALWAILFRASRASSFGRNPFFHAMLFGWLAWYAFPYLGELP
jgi:hypothetical protein